MCPVDLLLTDLLGLNENCCIYCGKVPTWLLPWSGYASLENVFLIAARGSPRSTYACKPFSPPPCHTNIYK